MTDRLHAYESWLIANAQEIENELGDIHPATWSKSGHVQGLLRDLDSALSSIKMVSVFLAAEKVLQEASAQGVSGS